MMESELFVNCLNFIYLPVIMFILPMLNGFLVVKSYKVRWLAVTIGVIILTASMAVNFLVLYVFNMTMLYMKSPAGNVSLLRGLICHLLVFISCCGITFWLYRIGIKKQKKSKANLSKL